MLYSGFNSLINEVSDKMHNAFNVVSAEVCNNAYNYIVDKYEEDVTANDANVKFNCEFIAGVHGGIDKWSNDCINNYRKVNALDNYTTDFWVWSIDGGNKTGYLFDMFINHFKEYDCIEVWEHNKLICYIEF